MDKKYINSNKLPINLDDSEKILNDTNNGKIWSVILESTTNNIDAFRLYMFKYKGSYCDHKNGMDAQMMYIQSGCIITDLWIYVALLPLC